MALNTIIQLPELDISEYSSEMLVFSHFTYQKYIRHDNKAFLLTYYKGEKIHTLCSVSEMILFSRRVEMDIKRELNFG